METEDPKSSVRAQRIQATLDVNPNQPTSQPIVIVLNIELRDSSIS